MIIKKLEEQIKRRASVEDTDFKFVSLGECITKKKMKEKKKL